MFNTLKHNIIHNILSKIGIGDTAYRPSMIVFMLILILCSRQPSDAQNVLQVVEEGKEKHQKPYPYGLDKVWSNNVSVNAMSPNGNWIVFTESFSIGENIMYLRQIDKDTNIRLQESFKNRFSENNQWFGSLSQANNLVLINLENGQSKKFGSVQEFEFSFDGRFLGLLQKDTDDTSLLKIIDLKNNRDRLVQKINKFVWNPTDNSLLAVKTANENAIFIYNAANGIEVQIEKVPFGNVEFLKWNETGSAAIVMGFTKKRQRMGVYYPKTGFVSFKDDLMERYLPDFELANKEPFLSKDGTTVLFFRKQKGQKLGTEDKVEIWKTSDPLLYPSLKLRKNFIYPFLLTAWFPQGEMLKEIASPQFPTAEMDIEHGFALVYNELQYGDQNTEFLKVDIYCKDIQTGEMHLIVAEQSLNDLVSISPSGKYVAYFKNGDWWIYDVRKNQAKCLTQGLATNFQDRDDDFPKNRIEVYGRPAWLKDDSKIIVFNKYDLWAVNTDGNEAKRITNGKEKECRYILRSKNNIEDYYRLTVGTFGGRIVDLEGDTLLLKINYELQAMGISLLGQDFSTTNLIFGDKSIFQAYQSSDGKKVIYSTESTIQPKALHYYNLKTGIGGLIYQSNAELLEYDLGQKNFIEYTIRDKKLRGILMYPTNFDPSKKYPLIVNIYEKTSRNAMEFYPPTGYNFQGFSLLDYTSSGYFVLLPDISYEIGKPGLSALECVNVATDTALKNKSIDAERIGLIGHSFGGYETAFIATQTDRFATYVAGAAATDLTSHYHGVNWNNSATDLWRYEDQQWRMGFSYYENKQAYLRNSPLEYVTDVKRPILLWTGDKDYQVAWIQSLEMYIALRRLKKEASLILVKDEGHSPWDTEKQLLLSTEIKKWFERHLKKENGAS
ncbi:MULTISPECIES: S9 family peptidase [Aequorivita]|uniref:S9 family peptidase n=1 Tax=Aequorivita iocasae TaxID=2803865 RepID=A0ABX7DRM9_9FLAO|nr:MULTISPECIES: prolyl oligopeptidase family serine peptidase [Aequorivita]QQX76465.1 S9 family peptidase [Aequorivita iocasae]UCA55937.1 prolyl oligopeptidase family serine peptidase [Aequorivita sp. F7]